MGCRSLLVLTLTARFVIGVTNGQGLGFVLNDISYPNGSTVLRTDIGEGDAALQCTTDRVGCCKSPGGGEFYFPDGTQVPILGNDPTRNYYRNRFFGGIRLNRWPNGVITGQFRCEITDASGTLVNLTINIVDLSLTVSITTSGTDTAGETYRLVCSARVTGPSSDQPTITWLDQMKNTVPSEMISTTGSVSTLTFDPLAASRAGTYTCRATVTGNITQTNTKVVSVEIPTPAVTITSSTIAVGSAVTLTCTVVLNPAVDVPVTVNTVWTGPARLMNATTAQPVVGSTTTYASTAMVNSFGRDQSGVYTCVATVSSSFITSSMASASTRITDGITDQHVTFQLSSSHDSIDVGFSLICNSTGGLVNSLSWRKDGFLLDNTSPLLLTDPSTFSYTNVLQVNSRTTGEYTCLTRGPNNELLNSTIFNVQAASPPVKVQASQSSASAPVEVSWSPPSGGPVIIGYRIFYHNQQNIFVSSYVTRIVFNFIEIKDELGEILLIRSESTQLPSEPVNVRITNEIVSQSRSSSTNVGIVVGVVITLAAIVVTNVIFVLCWLRRKKLSKKCEISVSTNMACGQVKMEPGREEYENPDKIRPGQGNYELMHHSADINDECSGSKQSAAVYITAKATSRYSCR